MDEAATKSILKQEASPENMESIVEKEHLVVLVHGLHGSQADFEHLVSRFSKIPKFVVYCSVANEGIFATQEGVDVGGKRLAAEIEEFVKKTISSSSAPKFKKFSIIGHSLGGLYSRYCINVLHQNGFFKQFNLIPTNYISLATPHLGSRRTPRSYFNRFVSWITRTFLSTTGVQLMLEDHATDPLLLQMSDPKSSFIEALVLFKKRIIYANVVNDVQVPYSTAAIVSKNPYLKDLAEKKPLPSHDTYKHIVQNNTVISDNKDYEATEALAISEEAVDHFSKDEKKDVLLKMLKNLNEIEWERVDVYYPSWLPHDDIVGKFRLKNAESDIHSILQHVLDQFSE